MKRIIFATAALAALSACAIPNTQPQPIDACITGSVEFRKSGQCVDWKTVTSTETVEEVRARGVSDGSIHSKDNLTSMGNAASDGAEIVRVRSTQPQTVSLREAGGGTTTIEVDAGDTLVEVSDGATVIAEFQGSGAKKTKATGNQTFNDVTEVEVTTSTRVRED
ncbi:MAG: lipoprotein [Pseudomonadota bacterium]